MNLSLAALFILLGALPAGAAVDAIARIEPPEQGFYAKRLEYDGIPIKAPAVVDDQALLEGKARLERMLNKLPEVRARLRKAGAELHIIGRDQVTSDLPEHRHLKGKPFDGKLTVDERTRGLGGLLVSCGEENLLKLEKDRYRGRDICVHEFAHCILTYGVPAAVRSRVKEQLAGSLAKGLWQGSYAASNPQEYFAELSMWYFGTHGDLHMAGARPADGPDGLRKYDPEGYALLDDFYSGRLALAGTGSAVAAVANPAPPAPKPDYPIQTVPFTAVQLTPGFWQARLETNRMATIPHVFDECEKTGRVSNFERAGRPEKGKFEGYFFNDSDLYKAMEAAADSLAVHPDPKLEQYLDGLIAKVAAAQENDGYLYTARTLCGPDYMPPGGKERWSDIGGGHELYCAGHLYEAAVAHFAATGKRTLLDVAIKNADLVCSVFNPQGKHSPPGHPEIELALVKLWRATGDEKYLRQARFFLDERGRPNGRQLYGTYSQDHKPLVEQTEAVGHAVRAAYLYSGMTDIAALYGDAAYSKALDSLWADVVGSQTYLTGGLGAAGGHEGFGDRYRLPNRVAYCETCAAIANALWNERMFLLHGDARYVDVLERILYNGMLSGVSLDGKAFFYPNPLESDSGGTRSPWFGCACCPPNIARILPQVPGLAYAHRGDELFVNLFLAGSARVPLAGGDVVVRQETRYPWEGGVKLTLAPEKAGEFTLRVRVPGWAREEALPSDLYRFESPLGRQVSLKVNGRQMTPALEQGYAAIRRSWRKGDVVEVSFPMPVRRVLANDKVLDDAGKVALQRGPVVYCVEGADVKGGKVSPLLLPDQAPLRAEFNGKLLGGVTVLRGDAESLRWADGRKSILRQKTAFAAIPYYAWANRGRAEMSVWLARTDAGARPEPCPTIASTSKATASGGDVRALNDQREPRSSDDHSNRFLHWWPHKGTQEWVQYDFAKPERVSAVEVYWFDDTGIGECRLPQSWRLLYREKGEWKPVANPSGFGCEGSRYNRTTFDPVETDALRIEVQLQPNWAGGIHEWRVEGRP